jgi:hypothetical protein
LFTSISTLEYSSFAKFNLNMGVEKETLHTGNGTDRPKKGDKVAMLYTGWLHDPKEKDNDFKGNKYVAREKSQARPLSCIYILWGGPLTRH